MSQLRYSLPSTLAGAFWPEKNSSLARTLRSVALVAAGSLLLTAGAKVSVPFYPVPMTLQTLALLFVAAAYGLRLSTVTILAYMAQGALGLPVFAGTPERGIGLAYMMGPTAGYILGYVGAAILVGLWAERGAHRSLPRLLGAMTVGQVLIYSLGFAWLAQSIGGVAAWRFGVEPFLLSDAVKTLLAALAVTGLWDLAAKAKGKAH